MNANPGSPGPQSPSQRAVAPSPGPQSPGGLQASPSSTPELSSVGKRFGAFCLEILLSIVTLGIGWLVWTFVIMGRGQTPAKQLLHMRVVRADGGAVSYGKMFVREFPAKIVIGFLAAFTIYIIYLWPLWDGRNQELWDKMVDTVVVEDPDDQLDPRALAA